MKTPLRAALLAPALLIISALAFAAVPPASVTAPSDGGCPNGLCPPGLADISLALSGANRQTFPVVRPTGPFHPKLSGKSLRNAAARYVAPSTIQLSYDDARKWVFQHGLDPKGYVFDIYGQRRAHRKGDPDYLDINVEHVWPESRFRSGWDREESAALDSDPIKSDLHNMYPVDTGLNSKHEAKPFGEIPRCSGVAACSSHTLFEPPNEAKGTIARSLFYFSVRYNLAIPADMEATLKQWNDAHPPTEADVLRNDAVQQIQGNRNPFVDDPTLADRITDF